jgi:chorismate mutase
LANDHSLAELRSEIDRIDAAMHRLLMERGEIIERLIEAKRTRESGSAFRPAREAEMMRRLIERHRGILPLDTAEGIWRVIIATFTYVQAPYAVHADISFDEFAMRDSARFHFGFTVPLVSHTGAAAAVAAVASSAGDLALVPAAVAGASAWWPSLEGANEPKIIARLPFVEREDHPAGVPVFVVSRFAPEAIVREVEVFSISVAGWSMAARRMVSQLADVLFVPERVSDGAALLVSVPLGRALHDVTGALVAAGASVRSATLVGSHATRYTMSAAGLAPSRR